MRFVVDYLEKEDFNKRKYVKSNGVQKRKNDIERVGVKRGKERRRKCVAQIILAHIIDSIQQFSDFRFRSLG